MKRALRLATQKRRSVHSLLPNLGYVVAERLSSNGHIRHHM
jgi:hypothetical protein